MGGSDRKPMLVRADSGLFAEVARAVAGPVDLATLAERFAELAIEATAAWRASIFLIESAPPAPSNPGDAEPTQRLRLWATHSRETDEATRQANWQLGLSLGAIDLDEVPARRELFELGQPFPIEDARASELVPEGWVETFGLGSLVVAPLVAGGEGVGIMVIDWPEPRGIPAHECEVIGAIAGTLALAVQNAALTETLALETQRLRGLSTLWGFEADALETYSAAIEDAIGPALGFDLVHTIVADDDLRSLGYFAEPDDLDRQLMERWERAPREADPTAAGAPSELAAPLLVGGRIVGVVRARARQHNVGQREAEMLAALARAFGRAIEAEADRREARRQELDLVLADERERVAARLHDTVGRLLYALNLRAGTLKLAAGYGDLAEEAAQIERLARSGLAGLRRAVATLASMRSEEASLLTSLEQIVADFQDSHDTAVRLAVDGSDKVLDERTNRALIRVVEQALANVERHAQATSVTVALDLRDDELVVRVRDDGLGLGTSGSPSGAGVGLDLARHALEPLGGTLDLVDAAPGVEIVARIPNHTTAPIEAQP